MIVHVDHEDLAAVLMSADLEVTPKMRGAFARLMVAAERGAKRGQTGMLDWGTRKIDVIKVWRAYTGHSLKEAKSAVESTPVALPRLSNPAQLANFKRDLRRAGARLGVVPA